jgi:hypothetical protein
MTDPHPACADYLQSLAHFPRYLANAWRDLGDGRGYFGDPSHLENGIRSMGNVVFTAALLVSDPAYTGNDRAELLQKARAGLAYLCHAHATGGRACADGQAWGGVWQSAWWTTRMALGAKLIWAQLDEAERAAVERVVTFEADIQLPRIVPSGLAEDTKAEENAWDAEILATAIALFPDHSHRADWWAKLCEFAYNTFSIAADHHDDTVTDGKPLRDWVYTVNLHSDFTLENHGAYHFCYVASPLHSLAWADYALRSNGIEPPAALQHHVAEVWQRAKPTFLGNRFAYVSGQDWARYTYGAYFIVPTLVWLQNRLSDSDARAIEQARFTALQEEQQDNTDGSFFGKRFTQFHYHGQPAKYETDCYANLGLAYALHRLLKPSINATPSEILSERLTACHVSPECGIAFARTSTLFASFSWRSLTEPYPLALFVPLADESLAEWQAHNLCGRIVLLREEPSAVWIRRMKSVEDGFHIQGTVIYRGRGKILYTQELDYHVNTDNNTARIKSRFIAQTKLFVRRAEGLYLTIANDRFNHYQRAIYTAEGSFPVKFDPARRPFWLKGQRLPHKIIRRLLRETLNDGAKYPIEGRWLNIDNHFGIISGDEAGFILRSPLGRNLPDGNLHYDILYSPIKHFNRYVHPGEELLSTDFLLVAGDSHLTQQLAETGV